MAAGFGQIAGRVWVIAHRGASHDAPEHTWAAYDRAVQQGADYLEADLRLTADGTLVCFHDPTVERTTDGRGPLRDLTLDELRTLDCGSWFNRANPDRADPEFAGLGLVTFEEQLRRYAGVADLRFHVETKFDALDWQDRPGEMERRLLATVELPGLPPDLADRVLIQSFNPMSLRMIGDLRPGLFRRALLTSRVAPREHPPIIEVAAPGHTDLLADPGAIAELHERGVEVHTWTVDDPAVMAELIEAGVDGIFTNQPGVLRRLLDDRYPDLGPGTGPPK